ncbi:MAG: helix-turn-helix domain-containing protein [Acidimicrobiia bacterium]|nr:helix-turn-helix domain-containing protein [Acidimicrobiia bacterium]
MSEQARSSQSSDGSILPLLDVGQAAERLGVTPRFVRRLVFERRLAYIKVGKYVRFDLDDLEAWLASHRVEALGRS